jgi:hypothetical protein
MGVTGEGPDNDCLFEPFLPKCVPDESANCPEGFNMNEDEQCFSKHNGCPDGYHSVDDDETGRCIPDSNGCPEGMIFRSDGKTCGYKEQLCQENSDLEGCKEITESCDPSYPDHCIKPSDTDLDCNWDGNVKDDEIPNKDFPVGKSDPHGFDKDNDGIGCENNGKGGNGNNNGSNDNDDNDIGNGNNDNDNSNHDIIVPSNSCDDISDTVDLSSEQIDPQDVRIIAF